LGEDFTGLIQQIANMYSGGNIKSTQIISQQIFKYIGTVLFSLQYAEKSKTLMDVTGTPGRESVALSDYVPPKVDPSTPCSNEEMLSFVAGSLDCTPAIPITVPCRFTDNVCDRAVQGVIDSVIARFGARSNATIACLYDLLDLVNSFLDHSRKDLDGTGIFSTTVNVSLLLLQLYVSCNNKSFELYELLRYLALNPNICACIAQDLSECIAIPAPNDPYCVHVAFIKMLTNVVSNTFAVDVTADSDLMKLLSESASYHKYFEEVTKTKSPDLLLALSVLFLNTSVMNSFSPFNLEVARLYPRILLAALRLSHKPLIRNILMGMATLMYNDNAAKKLLASCPPLLVMLAEAEKISSEDGVVVAPYATFCSTALTLTDEE